MDKRRIVIFESMTADGYFAGSDGNLDWVMPDEAQARAAANEIARFDTVLLGGLSNPVRLDLIDTANYESGDVMFRYARELTSRASLLSL